MGRPLMKHRSALLLLIAGLVAASQSASLPRISSSNEFGPLPQSAVCAQTCNLLNRQIQYTPGQTYVYNVQLMTRIGEQANLQEDEQACEPQEVQITAQAEISAYSQCELVMKLRGVTFSGFEHQASEKSLAQQLESSPIHFALEDGVVTDVCADQADEQWLVDVKKSIISALQMSSQSVAQQQTLIETDISGRCETVYEPLESNSEVTVIRKTKNRSKCSDRHQANIAFFPASYGINQALQSSLSPLLTANSSNECTQVVKGQIVESVACEDRQTLRYPLNIPITSRIELQLTEKRPEITVQRIEEQSFRRHRLTLSSSSSYSTFDKDNSLFSSTIEQSESRKRDFTVSEVQHLLKGICAKVAYSVHHDVPVLFHELITALHYLPAADQAQVWTQIHSGAICSSPKLQDLFLDAAALSGSEGSIEVLLQAYQQQHVISPARANYLFGLLAFSKQPTVGAARRLVNYIKSQHQQQQLVQLPRGVLFGATGFVHNLQVVAGQRAHQMVDIEGVRAVVRDTVHTLIEAIKTIIPQASTTSPQQQQQALTLIYSLKNLVLVQELNTDEQLTIARQLVDILRTVSHPHTTHSVEISAALVRTLVNAGIDDSIRQYLLESILIQESQQPSIELQIEAYRAVVLSGATQSQLQLIKQWTERASASSKVGSPQQQLVNYIRSHQANLRTTSDPHKQAILPAGAPVFESPSGAWFGVSRNYELSYVNQGIGAGVTLETDVIYQGGKQSPGSFIPVPQTVAFNFTIPIGGQELQLVEVRLHQHGLEPLIEKHMRQMEQSSSRASFASQPWKVARETLKYIIAHGSEILEENPSVRVLLQVIVDGKTVVLADEQDLISNDSSIEEQSFMQELMARLHSTVTIDRAFAVTPIDSVVRFPSVNGLPVTVRLNSTFVIGFKSEVAVDIRNPEDSVVSFAIYPSVAATTETAVAFHAGPEKKVVEYVQSVSSAPQLNFLARVNRGRIVTFKVDLPKEKYSLARIESVVYSRNAISGERVRLTPKKIAQIAKYPDVHICSRATEKALGVSICYDLSYGTVHHGHGLDILAEVTVVKTDAGLSSYEATLESPLKFGQIMQAISKRGALKKEVIEEMTPFRFHFNTPGSEVDRKIALEVELANAGALVKEARLRLRTPWKAISGQAVLRNEAKERVAKLELTVDEAKWMAAEVALEVVRRGPKTEWKPRVVITALESVLERPIHLTGALSVSRGRKTAVHLSLEDVIARQQYITAGYIRERPSERNGLGRTSADLSVSLRGLVAKGAAAFELGERLIKVDISSDYKLPSWRRAEKAKVALKLQNHSNNEGSEKKVIKMTGIGQIKASQLSKYEITYSQNVHVISGEQLEHDLKLDWASQQEDSSNNTPQIRLHQSAQKTGQRGKIDLEATSLVIYRPENVHYEVKATGGLIGVGVSSGLKRYNIAISGEGKHSSKSNFRGELSYEQKAKSPALKMEMAAQLKAPEAGIDFVYRDEIEEKAPGQYHGHLLVQMSPAEKYDVTYVYRLVNDRSKKAVEHSMDVMLLKDARKRVALKHYGLLRLEDGGRAMSLKSRLTDEENKGAAAADIWNAQVDLAPGRKEVSFSHLPREIRAQAKYEAVYQGPSSAQWSFSSPAFNHQAEYENSGPQGQYWSFDSKTKKSGENLMEIQSKHNAKLGHRRLRLSSQYFDGECELELPSTNEQSKKAKLRFDLPNSWAHESTFSRAPISSSGSGLILVDSRTQYQGAPVVDLAARYDPQSSAGQFKLNTPLNSVEMQAEMAQAKKIALKKALLKIKRGADYEHQSQLDYEPSTSAIDFESVTSKSGKDMAKVKYQYAGDEQLLHQFDLATPEDYSVVGGQWSGRFDQRRRSAKIDWTNKAIGMKHNTQISCAEPQQIISIDSATTDYQTGTPILLVKGAMDPKERSYISLQSGKARKVNFETRRSKRSAKLDLDYDQYRHQSEISGGDYDDDNQQQWKAKSSTRKAGKSIFDFDALIQPSQQYGHISLSRGDNGELFKHESTFKMEKMMDQEENKKSAHLKSNTLYRGEPLAELDAMLSGLRGANKVDGSIIGYELKSLLDVPSQVASVDLKSRRSGRHLLGSVAVNQEAQADRSFHFDFAWDIDRDPASKVALDLLIKRVPIESRSRSAGQQVMIEASAAYAESKLVYNMQYVPKSGGFSSPHPIRLSLSFIPSPNAIHNQRDSWQLIYLHRMEQSDKSAFTCKWEWIVGGQRQYSLQINGKIEEISGSKKFIFSAKTTAPASKPQLAATFNLVAGKRAPNQYFFDASATAHGDQKRYQAVFDLTKHLETRKVDGKLEIRLPAFQVHVAAFSLDLTERKFSLELINEKTGKVVEVEASYAHHLTHLKVASQGASSWFVPKVDALVRYVPGEELHARLALDEERKFELTAKYSGELSKLKFYVLTKVDSVYTPSVEFIAEGRKPSEDDGSSSIGAQRSVAITGKWNMVEVVKGSFNQAAVRQWTAEGFVAAVGSGDKIVEGSVVSTPGQSEHYTTYEVKVQPKESNVYGVKAFGAKIEERRPTAENEYIRSVKVELFQQAAAEEAEKKLILSTEVSLKHRKWAQVPEMVEVSLRHIPSASHGSLSVAIREQVKESEQQEDYSSLFSTAPETASIASQKRSSVLRDQMLIGWNQKSVGFALITSEWASAEAVEHSLKVYTPSGRVVKHRCGHVWSDELIFLKQSLQTDEKTQREPLYQSTVIVQKSNPIQGGSYIASGYTGKLVIESFKFARSPKTVSFEVKPASQQRPLDAKLIIDIAQSEKEALTLKAVVERKAASTSASNGRYFGVASLNQTIHFEAKSADASVLDFAVDGHVSQSSVGLLWKNLNRKGRQQQGHYLLQFIGEDRFETVLSNPAAQYHVSGIYKRKDIKEEGGSPMVMDLTIKKSISKHSNSYSSSKSQPMLVSEHKVHIESTDRCIRAEIEDVQKISSSRQVNLCADLKRANIFNLDIDSISGSGQKTAEFSARLDAKSAAKTLALGAHWNPVYSRKLLQTLLNIKESASTSEDLVEQISQHEVVQELSAKYSALFRSLFANAAQPLTEVAKELAPIAAEYGLTEEVLQKWTAAAWAPIESAIDSISEYSRENIDQLTGAYTEAVEEVKKACARSASCRSVSEALEKGNEEVARLASRSIVGLLQKTHRFVVKTKGGALLEKLNAEEVLEQLQAMVPEPVTEAIKSAAQTAYGWARDVTLNPSGPFAGVLRHLESIFGELIKGASGSESIRWERIESSVSEAVHLLTSPSAWASSVRVLLWDPVNGQLAVEVKSPQTFTTAAAIAGMGNETENINSSSSWLNGINSYDRYAAKARFF